MKNVAGETKVAPAEHCQCLRHCTRARLSSESGRATEVSPGLEKTTTKGGDENKKAEKDDQTSNFESGSLSKVGPYYINK